MTNFVHPKALEQFLQGGIDWMSDAFRLALIDGSYALDDGHLVLDDVDPGAIVADVEVTQTSATDGVADAADTVAVVGVGESVTQAWLYRDTGDSATSELIAYYDSDDVGTPFSYTSDGGDLVIRWSDTDNRVFRI